MRKWYEHGDERLGKLLVAISRIFRKSRLTLDFDQINQPVSTMRKESYRVYELLGKKCDDEFFDLAYYVYMEAYEEAAALLKREALPRAPDESRKRASGTITKKWLDRLQGQYDPVTKYVYNREIERKRARFFEATVADTEHHDRHGMEADYKTAEKAWVRQTRQAMITVEDAAARTAYKEAGVEKVVWRTEEDEKVCPTCVGLNGLIFPIDKVPDKPHINCRCWVEPVDDDKDIAYASPAFLNKNDKLFINGKKIKPIPGYTDIIVHADKYGFIFKNADEKESNVSAAEFAKILLSNKDWYSGGDIRLIACSSAAEGAVAAQALANILGVRIMAHTADVWVDSDGNMGVGRYNALTDNDGWVILKPKK